MHRVAERRDLLHGAPVPAKSVSAASSPRITFAEEHLVHVGRDDSPDDVRAVQGERPAADSEHRPDRLRSQQVTW
jgi:hypothetical protein